MVDEDEEDILTIDDEHREEAPRRTQVTEDKGKNLDKRIQVTGKRSSLQSELIFLSMFLDDHSV